jgi:hypothetical protein
MPVDLDVVGIRPAMELLPSPWNSPAARAMLRAIALQESRLRHRRQINGPARGFYQFELGNLTTQTGGVVGVLNDRRVREHVTRAVHRLQYMADPMAIYVAIEHNDVLASVLARALLWTVPEPLPNRLEVRAAWDQYVSVWRPGKPHPQTWDGFYQDAWEMES